MNERIKELAIEAGMIVGEANGFDMTRLMPREVKFAELIVRECLERGKLTQSQSVVNGSEEYNAGREMGIEVFMNQIKQHFGVEK